MEKKRKTKNCGKLMGDIHGEKQRKVNEKKSFRLNIQNKISTELIKSRVCV